MILLLFFIIINLDFFSSRAKLNGIYGVNIPKELVNMDEDRRNEMICRAVQKMERFIADLSDESPESTDHLTGDLATELLLWLLNPAKNRAQVSAVFRCIIEEAEEEIGQNAGSQTEVNYVMAMAADEIVRTALRPFGAKMLKEDLENSCGKAEA
jgi:hypothetical protein